MKRVVFASILALLIISGIALAYFYYLRYRLPQTEPLGLVPKDACFIIKTKNLLLTGQHLKENLPWNTLAGFPLFHKAKEGLAFLDSASEKNEKLRAALEDNTLFISAHITKADAIDFLFLAPLPKTGEETFVNEMIAAVFGSGAAISKRTYEGVTIKEVFPEGSGHSFAFTIYHGIFAGSFSAFLVEDAIREENLKRRKQHDPMFDEVFQLAGKKVDANIFIRYENFSKLISFLVNPEFRNAINPLSFFGQWSGFDLKLKPNSLSLSGFTSEKDTLDYLSVFAGQKPQTNHLISILPKRIAFFSYNSFSDYSLFQQKMIVFRQAHHEKRSGRSIEEINTEYKIKTEEKIIPWLGNEYALAVADPGGTHWENHAFAIFHSKDIDLAKTSLHDLGMSAQKYESSVSKDFVPSASETYKGRTIEFLGIPYLLPALFGSDFEKMEKLFYTFINDYVVFANQASALRSYIDDVEAKKLLINESAYQSVSAAISSQSNRYIYVNIPRTTPLIRSIASEGFVNAITSRASMLQDLGAFTFQASGDGERVYSSAIVHQNVDKKADASLIWTTLLDTSISSSPAVVRNPKTGDQEILVQDDGNTLYLINSEGEILWKNTLKDRVISSFYQVDYFKNEKYQFLFNTSSAIYLIDRKGEKIKNYPIRLSSPATTGLSVFDYDGNKEYRIFVPCANGKVMALQLTGKTIDGWSFRDHLDLVAFPVQYFKLADKDFLIVSDTTGAVFFLDRKGKSRVEVSEKLSTRFTSPFVLQTGKTIETTRMVTSDVTGRIVSIFFDGRVEMRRFKDWNPDHYFDFKDINADQSPDYIFFDSNALQVYNQDTTTVFTHTFKETISEKPIFFPFSNAKGKIGMVSSSSNQIFLFNDDGSMSEGFPMKGNTSFVIDDLDGNGHYRVIVGSSDKNVYCYSLE